MENFLLNLDLDFSISIRKNSLIISAYLEIFQPSGYFFNIFKINIVVFKKFLFYIYDD